MLYQNCRIRPAVCAAGLVAAVFCMLAGGVYAAHGDPRCFKSGREIPSEGYCDQPYLVVTRDGSWLCTMTTGKGREGQPGQHVVAAISADQGRTWSKLIDIEPADGREASWVVPLATPGGRVYAFYDYNGQNAGHGDARYQLPKRGATYRADTIGWYCYKYSDDCGRSWSAQRSRLPMPLAACDRTNDWEGRIQLFWGIDKPCVADGVAYFAFTRLGKYMLDRGEGWLYRSDSILAESEIDRIRWQLLPEGDRGIRREEFGSIQEEHNVVPLGGGRLYCVYRTTMGYPCHAYSENGGRTWSAPAPMTYTPGGRRVRNPRACPKLWRTENGRFLFWYHNNGEKTFNQGGRYGSRNIAWLAGGTLVDGRLHWSQPEIIRYCVHPLRGCSYPDLIEDKSRFFISATQKTEARIGEIDRELLDGLWAQERVKAVARRGLVLALEGKQSAVRSVKLPDLAAGGGFAVDLWVALENLASGQILLDSRGRGGSGITVTTTQTASLRLDMSDGRAATRWDSDPGLLRTGQLHHVVFIVDGGPKLISVVVDGVLCDGGRNDKRRFGYGRFLQTRYRQRFSDKKEPAPEIGDVTGGETFRIAPAVKGLRLYNRCLRTSEAIGNWRAGPGRRERRSE